MVMIIAAILGGGAMYTLLRIAFLDEAHAAGVREYAGIHALVTGKLPMRLGKTSDEKLLELACAVQPNMWKYRSVDLRDEDASDPGKANKTGYLLRTAGNTFLFLTSEGLLIKSYGDNAYEMKESDDRPMSNLAQRCPSLKK